MKRTLLGRTTRMFAAFAGVAILVGSNVGAGCSSSSGGDSGVISVPLQFRPSDNDRAPVVNIPNRSQVKLFVNVADKRDEQDKATIGVNREEHNNIPVRASGSPSVPEFVAKAARDEIRSSTLATTEDMAQCTHTLDLDILTFNVLEDNMFNAEVRLEARLVDPTGKELWRGSGSGTSKTFGRSRSAENYNQTLSNSIKIAMAQILGDADFKKALSSGAAAAEK
jgi:hypothetical protein